MLAAWMLFVVAVSGLVGGAAMAIERSLHAVGLPVRGVWMGAFVAVLVLAAVPPLGLLGPDVAGSLDPQVSVTIGPVEPLGPPLFDRIPASFPVEADGVLSTMTRPLLWFWAALALGMAFRFALGALRLRRGARRWTRVDFPGRRVLVSDEMGPAVLGYVRGRMVIPRWCLELPAASRDLILAHEEEHLLARDPLLVGTGLVMVLILPWNPLFWWFLRRMRAGIEVDCDARVVRRFPDRVRAYGELLLQVGARSPDSPHAFATFSEHPSTLGRRIHMLADLNTPRSRVRALALMVGGGLLILVACLVPGPDRAAELLAPEVVDDEDRWEADPPDAPDDGRQEPRFTPFTVAPEVVDRDRLRTLIDERYPAQLRDAGIGGRVVLHLFIASTGEVQNALVFESSGHSALDAAALGLAPELRFTPALNREEAVAVWVAIPFRFEPQGGDPTDAPEREPRERVPFTGPDTPPGPPTSAEPSFTPFTTAPEVNNRVRLEELLAEEYPPMLRDAGIGGRVVVHFFINADGTVENALLYETSGHSGLDEAALRIARELTFTPARNQDQEVPVWVAIPVTFRAG